MSDEVGLRERKKQRTRELIAEQARRLFAERGFDTVTVAEVARAAEVSEGTVFNYFRTKDDLFFTGMTAFEAQLVDAVASRPPGESVVAAFERFLLDSLGRLAAAETVGLIVSAAEVVAASPTLQAREREIVAGYTDALAAVIGRRGRDQPDVESWAVANALMGVQRALVRYVRGRVLAGRRGPELATDAAEQAKRAFARLERGLAGYGTASG